MEYDKIEIVGEKKKEEGIIKIPKERLVNMQDAMDEGSMHVGLPIKNNNAILNQKAIWLDYDYDWVIGRDE